MAGPAVRLSICRAGDTVFLFLRVRPRNGFLILHADSRAGKTSFAESRFQNPFAVTVEDNPELGLKGGFDRAVHDGVVLGNCNTFGQLLC